MQKSKYYRTIPKAIRDNPVVYVYGDFEKSTRLFKRRCAAAGTFKLLKDRKQNPSGADRKRLKKRKAAIRRIKAEKKKGIK